MFTEEFKNLVWLSQQGNTFAEFFELDGKFPDERSRQLWSDTGFLSLVYHGLFGMKFLPNGVEFAPVKPGSLFAETISLRGVHYRNMILNIQVSGSGIHIASFQVDGRKMQEPFIKADFTGTHEISITLVQTAADDVSETLNQFPIDIESGSRMPLYGGLALLVLLFLSVKGPMRRVIRKTFGEKHRCQ